MEVIMPGPNIATLLKPLTCHRFRYLVDRHAHMLLGCIDPVISACQIIAEVLSEVPYSVAISCCGSEYPHFVDMRREIETLSIEIDRQIRSLYFPENNEVPDKQRWEPYNDLVWDTWVGEVIEALAPRISRLNQLITNLGKMELHIVNLPTCGFTEQASEIRDLYDIIR